MENKHKNKPKIKSRFFEFFLDGRRSCKNYFSDTSEIDEKKSKIMSDFLNENNKTSPRITKESKVKMKIFENNKNAYEVVTID